MPILLKIKSHILDIANKNLGVSNIEMSDLSYPPNSEMGDLSLPLFKIAKELGKSPKEIGEELIKYFSADEKIKDAKLTGPYLNIFLNREYLAEGVLKEIDKEKEKYGQGKNLKGKKIMVEFAHPNPFKSFHIGHLRNLILGESIVRLLEAQNAEVIRTNYQGDVGMHIAKCLWSFQKIKEKDYPETADEKVALLGKCYAEGAQKFEDDKDIQTEIKEINKKIYSHEDEKINNLWDLGKKWSLEKFHEIYERLYSRFDREYMESEVIEDCLKYIEKAYEKNILEKSEGAMIFKERDGLDTRVFLNSEGLPTYDGKELGLAHREFTDFGELDLCIHNVAVEQISFFKVNFKVQEELNEKMFKGKQYHNAYEFVGLKKGKMSSRKGQVILGNDILNEALEKINQIVTEKNSEIKKDEIEIIAVAAIKYAFLNISPFKYLSFDMEESVSFSGNSGPYLLYTFTRIQSILKKAEQLDIKINKVDYKKLGEDIEVELLKTLAKYPEIVLEASTKYDPSEIAKYLFELTKTFNDYYHKTPILQAEDETQNARLALLKAVGQTINNALNLLGIKTINKM